MRFYTSAITHTIREDVCLVIRRIQYRRKLLASFPPPFTNHLGFSHGWQSVSPCSLRDVGVHCESWLWAPMEGSRSLAMSSARIRFHLVVAEFVYTMAMNNRHLIGDFILCRWEWQSRHRRKLATGIFWLQWPLHRPLWLENGSSGTVGPASEELWTVDGVPTAYGWIMWLWLWLWQCCMNAKVLDAALSISYSLRP